ncbi:LuxR C-terminal-related transcriptional regulator [Gloeocapsopsis dulcis]|uniref:LuxR family transcriptional regulator n=1 Tax=Gloeocapsopsis dulcis AAB1 = 1H9 TaxID=1433147 RepID=A0A6N8FVE6_9CHRO|nr:LuxR C-terminal-related transcriptional regulator [Gloeocapsopsis dulcis]MUL37043.1 LuxR family transcriptional regulator [Gloeocapsopsis dulcis AAB1 = 1H9]WNN87896.1 LuxR C-terminal-related transcriptional regulator [Gloeocapsopsis dulcis]
MSSLLLATKFYIPTIRSSLVRRDRLIAQLNQGKGCKLILISATAGFGKTTLLSEWSRQAEMAVSWLSLDEGDNQSLRFWTYFVTALKVFKHEIGESTLAMLHAIEPASFETFLIPLINEIASLPDEYLLVLDDYHVITAPLIQEALTFFLEHLPPQLHLAIASRVDPPLPLARMRACAQLTEIRTADLRFTVAEVAEFINQSSLQLSQEQIEKIQARTEGWVVALQLALLSVRNTKDSALIALQDQRYILDYLVEEVLECQPKHIQTFLLRTSILERMCDSLCAAVVGEDELNVIELEQLEHCNLFVVPLDRDRNWYRYHHLFRELLHHRLHRVSKQVPEYHRRAAWWYTQHGFVLEAIEHAIASQDFLWAAELIEQEAQTSNPQFDSVMLLAWLEALPQELVENRPWLLLAEGWARYSLSQFEAAFVAVHNIERLLTQPQRESANNQRLWGLVTAIKGMQARQQGDGSKAIALMQQALQLLPQDGSWIRAIIVLNLGVTYFVTDNFALAIPVLNEATRIGQVKSIADPAIAGLYLQAQFQALRGRMDQAIALCQQGVDLATERGWLATYAGVLVQVAIAELLREQNQLEAAAQNLHESIERGSQIHQPGVMMGYITLARVRQAQGDTEGAWAAIQAAEQLPTWLWPTILSVAACRVRLQLAQGNLEEAIAWAENSDLGVDDVQYSSELDYLTLARVLIARGTSANESKSYLDDAMQLLVRLYDFAKAGGRKARVMEVLILQALVFQARGDIAQALHCLEKALYIPRSEDYIRLFVDEGKPMIALLRHAATQGIHPKYVSRLFAAFGRVIIPTPAQALIEPLSHRELEVLHYLASGLSNQAIANELIVSLPTVKWHARNIYSKLNASNRTQAVMRAREIGLLE